MSRGKQQTGGDLHGRPHNDYPWRTQEQDNQPAKINDRRKKFEIAGYLVTPGALSAEEVKACLDASRRAHEPLGAGQWRQITHLPETEPIVLTGRKKTHPEFDIGMYCI